MYVFRQSLLEDIHSAAALGCKHKKSDSNSCVKAEKKRVWIVSFGKSVIIPTSERCVQPSDKHL